MSFLTIRPDSRRVAPSKATTIMRVQPGQFRNRKYLAIPRWLVTQDWPIINKISKVKHLFDNYLLTRKHSATVIVHYGYSGKTNSLPNARVANHEKNYQKERFAGVHNHVRHGINSHRSSCLVSHVLAGTAQQTVADKICFQNPR